MIPYPGKIFSLDWGERRIGLAVSDEMQIIATPLTTLLRRAGKRFPMPEFMDLAAAHHPVGIIVGLPLTSSGDDSPATVAARELAQLVAHRTELPVELVDERMTTARALTTIRAAGGSTRGRKADIDSLAAAILLQNWLEGRRSAR